MALPNQPVQQTRRVGFWTVALVVVLALMATAAAVTWYGWNQVQAMLEPVSSEEQPITVSIPRGATSAQVGEILAEAGVIHSALFFRLYMRYQQLDGQVQAGNYILSPALAFTEIVDKLTRGEVYRETIRFTVPEGLFLPDVAARLASQGIVDAERFLALAADASLWQDFWFVPDIPGDQVDIVLEGYLFPDTYEIFADIPDREGFIIGMMLRRFENVFDDQWRQRATDMGMTVHQVVTLAAIVEKEAVVSHEQQIIAAVFHNRLASNMPLQSCATVNYVLGDFSIRYLTTAQTRTPSPYNTYLHRGLPPGPIVSPGRGAIEAVLYPADVDYLFFVAKDDGSNEHYFARTYAEHQRNIDRARANRR